VLDLGAVDDKDGTQGGGYGWDECRGNDTNTFYGSGNTFCYKGNDQRETMAGISAPPTFMATVVLVV
jgi:hypothetical protein